MIALFFTLVVAAYLLGPDLVSRWVLGFVCPRKNIIQSKGEELTRAIAWAIIPLAFALLWAWYWGPLARCAGWKEWKLFFAGAYSNAIFRENSEAIFHATKAIFWWNVAILWRLYVLVFVFWILVDITIYNFGYWRHLLNRHRLSRLIGRLLTLFIIPRVSEWHVFLSNMLADRKDIRVHADILTKSNVLVRGYVEGKMLTSDGALKSIVLGEPWRFRREEYMAVKLPGLMTPAAALPEKNNYWAKIPSKTFVVMASEIVTINLTHASPSAVTQDAGIVEALRRLLDEYSAGRTSP